MNGFTDKNVPDQSGKCFLVTGANTGIGFETSRVLAQHGARVLMACRDRTKAENAMARIRQQTPAANLAFLALDLADLESVRQAAATASAEPRIDALVNNAGVMFPPLSRTAQGFELQFGVNYLAPFALTALLLPKLAQTPGARVVMTSSIAHKSGKLDWDDLQAEKSYSKWQRYAASKLADLMFVHELDKRLRASGSPVVAVGCHPGVAVTELGRYSSLFVLLSRLASPILNSAGMGAWPTLQAATGPVEPGGYYGPTGFREMRGPSAPARATRQSANPALTRKLWDVSVRLTGIDPGLAPAI
jgi:NAD(P)-dependent dehydrogenase (short-subunit alcohol dehydrogenase family)